VGAPNLAYSVFAPGARGFQELEKYMRAIWYRRPLYAKIRSIKTLTAQVFNENIINHEFTFTLAAELVSRFWHLDRKRLSQY